MAQFTGMVGWMRRMIRTRGCTAPRHWRWGLGLVAAVLLGLSWTGRGSGAPGDLDHTFGAGGIAITFGPRDVVRAMVQQPDGKLVLAGTSFTLSTGFILLVRYLPDGRGDVTFGSGGKVTVPVGSSGSANALVLQPDGKFLVAGSVTVGASDPDAPPRRDLLLARFSPDGHLDAPFGSGGLLTTTVESNSAAFALLQQPDGKLVVAALSDPAPANHHTGATFLVRYHADGRVDASFGTEGTVTLGSAGVPGSANTAGALIRQPDGKLVVAPPGPPLRVVRVQPDGQLDAAFGRGGRVATTVEQGGSAGSALLQPPDGELVLASSRVAFPATSFISNHFDVLLARYQALGCPAVEPAPCLASLAAFVTEVYQAAFARQPDAGEEADWIDVLTTAPTPGTVRAMLHVVFDGPEFRQRPVNPWQYVEALFRAMLGRDPAPAELDEWVQAVLDRFNTLLPEFIESPEFQHLVPSCQDQAAVTLLVGRLYQQVLRRVASAGELAWWTQDITTGCALEEAVESFFTAEEYLGVPRTLADHVAVLYRALLAREPEVWGLTWWVDDLAGQLAAFEDDVMASPEFEARVYALFP
jgi:uncharacterized delta-60 repeat protein